MSLETLVLADGSVPPSALAYLAQRARSNCYDYVMRRFVRSGLSQAELARRTGKDPAQINRTLASPGNWTIGTMAELLAALAEEEFIPSSISLKGRAPRNFTQADLLAREGQDDDREPAPLSAINVKWLDEPKRESSSLPKEWDIIVNQTHTERADA